SPAWEGRAVSLDGGANQGGEVEPLPLAVSDGLLDPRGGSHGRQDRAQTLAALPGAGKVHAGVVAHATGGLRFGLQVLERRANDGERRADLVSQLARERAQVPGVFVQPPEQ